MTRVLICIAFLSVMTSAFAQTVKVKPGSGAPKDSPIDFKLKDMQEKERVFLPTTDAKSQVPFHELYLVDANGKKVELKTGKTMIIEYWSAEVNDQNLYWNKMRELEAKHGGAPDIEFVSVNYDFLRSGKKHREHAQNYLSSRTKPQNLVFDGDDGFRDVFEVRGPIFYMLIDHRGQYTYSGRGDDPEAIKVLTEHFDNAVKYHRLNIQAPGEEPKN